MADVNLLKKVDYPHKPCLLKMADKVLYFARNACGYENITYKKVENAKNGQEQYQVSQALKVKSAFTRVLCALVALALIIPTLLALAVKACLKGRQDQDVAKIHSLGVSQLQVSGPANTPLINGPSKPSTLPPASITPAKPKEINASKEHLQKASVAIGNFANELCVKIAKKEGNKSYSISPVSIVAALGMCLHAIHPSKKELFLEKIGLKGLSTDEAHNAIALTLRNMMIPTSFKDGTINIAQGVAFKTKNVVSESFIKLAQEVYAADLIHSQDIVKDVNSWVSEKTNEKIPKLIDESYDLVLLNALYLNLQWVDKFKKHRTQPGEFTCLDGSKTTVSMMHQKGDFKVFQGPNFDLLEKPYKSPDGRSLSQVILLPKDPKTLPAIEKELTAEKLQSYRTAAKMKYDVSFSLPKTKAEFATSLMDIMKQIGMPFDIDPNVASLGVTEFIHKTFVATNEEGTEAAAASGLAMKCCIAEPFNFHVDRAYTYFIMDRDTVIFRGRVSDKGALVLDR